MNWFYVCMCVCVIACEISFWLPIIRAFYNKVIKSDVQTHTQTHSLNSFFPWIFLSDSIKKRFISYER